jgi:nickel superoxide dismutase
LSLTASNVSPRTSPTRLTSQKPGRSGCSKHLIWPRRSRRDRTAINPSPDASAGDIESSATTKRLIGNTGGQCRFDLVQLSPCNAALTKENHQMFSRFFEGATVAHAHCDLYCGVYDPAQAKIEALSCLKTIQKYHDSDDDHFKTRCIIVKEQRAEEVKHHLMVLWADFFTKDHFAQFPQLHEMFWDAIHGAGDVKKSLDAAPAEALLAKIDEISDIFWQTDKAKGMGVYPPS